MAEQASSFFEAASAASDLGADRDLQNETRLTHLRTPSLPEVALRGELQLRVRGECCSATFGASFLPRKWLF